VKWSHPITRNQWLIIQLWRLCVTLYLASAQNCFTLGSFCITLPGYYAASVLWILCWLRNRLSCLPDSHCGFWQLNFEFPQQILALYSPETLSSGFSLPLCYKILSIDFPAENFSPQKIYFLNLFVCFPNDPQVPSCIFLLGNQRPRLKHNQRLRSFWLDPWLFLEVSPWLD